MTIGQTIETGDDQFVEIKKIGTKVAKIYILDEDLKRIPLFRKEGFLEGVLTLKK